MALRTNRSFDTHCQPFSAASIAEAAALIAAGEPVAVPTETVYGLAADATNPLAVARIYEAKGRPSFNPLIVHAADLGMAATLGAFDNVEHRLAAAFWPGPLTLVVPRHPHGKVASLATAGLDSIALRVPAHRAMQALIAASGRPLAAPSANASGRISPTRAEHVVASLGGRIALVIDDGPCAAGLESTIVQCGPGGLTILRPGPITAEQLHAAAGIPVMTGAADGPVIAPGQLASHYAPTKPVRLHAHAFAADEWGIGFGAVGGNDNLSASADLTEAAARLFDALHTAEQSGQPRIAVAEIPDAGLGAAINDRLRRAAAPR